MATGKLTQSGDWDFIDPEETDYVDPLNRTVKAIRVDQDGVATITPVTKTTKPAGNYVQGEVLHIQGRLRITTDATCRLQVFY